MSPAVCRPTSGLVGTVTISNLYDLEEDVSTTARVLKFANLQMIARCLAQ